MERWLLDVALFTAFSSDESCTVVIMSSCIAVLMFVLAVAHLSQQKHLYDVGMQMVLGIADGALIGAAGVVASSAHACVVLDK